MACADFDGRVVRQDDEIAVLAKQFVCVRIQSMNGVNLNLFPFEGDLTWMAFFMDGNDRFYARYGGREDFSAESHLTKASLVHVMRRVLELHNSGSVQVSRYEGSAREGTTPEEIPTMSAMMAPRKQKCIHCHDVKVARLRHSQSLGQFTRDMVFTYPTASSVGILLDSNIQNHVQSVTLGSPAERAGISEGDILLKADGQRILTLADFSRVLERTPKESTLPIELRRGDRTIRTELKLSGDWRRNQDPSWRESLHVAGPGGGFWGMKLNDEERRKLGLPPDGLAVRVTAIFGDHARRAGLKNGDVLIRFDGIQRDLTIQQLHAHLHLNKNYGDSIALVLRRDGQELTLEMTLPSQPPNLE